MTVTTVTPKARREALLRRGGWFHWAIAVLLAVGIVMDVAASYMGVLAVHGDVLGTVLHEFLWVVIGIIAFGVVRLIPLDRVLSLAPLSLALSVIALLGVLVPGVGVSVGGSSRWFGVGFIQVQPSEIVKLALILQLVRLIEYKRSARASVLGPVLLITASVAGLVFIEPDMGTAMIVSAIGLAALFIAGVPAKTLGVVGALVTTVGALGAFSSTYRRLRLLSFLHPWTYRMNFSYQEVQSLGAFASGHLAGTGLGSGLANWGYLPNAQTDFIFAVIGQDFGLIGAIAVLGCLIGLCVLLLQIAQRLSVGTERNLVFLVAVWLFAQTVLNVGAVIGVLPVTGVPLPLISAGGSSIVMTLSGLGIVSGIVRRRSRMARP
ncbi:MAG: FtsW/RodA/SpoVE family cell cycle protein [Ferrimicrobium sp.]